MQGYREIKNATSVASVRLVRKVNTERAHAALRDVLVSNPTLTYIELAGMLRCSPWLLHRVAAEFGVRRPRGSGSPARRGIKAESRLEGE